MSNNPKKVIMYKTTDGKLHETLEDAKIHENRAKVEKYATPFLVSVGARKYSDVLFETILESSSDIQRLAAVLASITGEVSEPKRRGRPKSAILVVDEAGEPVTKVTPRVVNLGDGEQPAKRRGRPPKVKVELPEGAEVPLQAPKRRGRPPKAITLTDGPSSEVIQDGPPVAAKRRGRPPKSSTTTVTTTQTLPPPPEVITVHTPAHTPPNIPASFAPPMPPMTPPPPFPPGAPSFPLA